MFLVSMSGASIMLAELAMEAGLPDGVLNIVHGTNVGSQLYLDDATIEIIVLLCFISRLDLAIDMTI